MIILLHKKFKKKYEKLSKSNQKSLKKKEIYFYEIYFIHN